ncbi:MAG: hypothetical protein JNN18_04650 [Rubrivivax sp.]|jgi:hypothetical protein|nr:hypothetical protein [Rubrivivax sp.]
MHTPLAPRLASIALSFVLTLAMLGSIDTLATSAPETATLAQQSVPADRA